MMSIAATEGYNQTDVRMIPEDWEALKLGNVAEKMVGGGTPSRSNKAYWVGDIPWVTVKDFATFNPYCAQETITNIGLKNSASNLIQKGTVITSTRMALGKAVIYAVDVSINQDLKAIFPTKDVNNLFLFYWFQKKAEYIDSLGGGSTVKGISLPDLRAIEFLKPPLPEQRAIATALSDVDALLAAQDKLIAKKRDIKQAAMQKLLTGKQRLLGFTGEWTMKRLDDICWYQEGPGVRNYQFTKQGVKLLNGTNIVNGRVALDTTNRYISEEEAFGSYKHFLVDEGDILIASSGVTIDKFHEKVAFASSEHLPLCMNTSTIRFKPNSTELLDKYLYFFLQSDLFKEPIGKQATGSAQLNFGPAHLKKINLSLPPTLAEQTAITNILSDMDADLTALEQQRDKTRALKQGMMQELLTGRIRLV